MSIVNSTIATKSPKASRKTTRPTIPVNQPCEHVAVSAARQSIAAYERASKAHDELSWSASVAEDKAALSRMCIAKTRAIAAIRKAVKVAQPPLGGVTHNGRLYQVAKGADVNDIPRAWRTDEDFETIVSLSLPDLATACVANAVIIGPPSVGWPLLRSTHLPRISNMKPGSSNLTKPSGVAKSVSDSATWLVEAERHGLLGEVEAASREDAILEAGTRWPDAGKIHAGTHKSGRAPNHS